jgi:hypothetical protein
MERTLGERIVEFIKAWRAGYPGIDVVFPGEDPYADCVMNYAKKNGWRYADEDTEDCAHPADTEKRFGLTTYDIEDLFINQDPDETRKAFAYVQEHLGFDFHIYFAMDDCIKHDGDGYDAIAYVFRPDPCTGTWVERALTASAHGKMIIGAPCENEHFTWRTRLIPFTAWYVKALNSIDISERSTEMRNGISAYLQKSFDYNRLLTLRRARADMVWLQSYTKSWADAESKEYTSEYGSQNCWGVDVYCTSRMTLSKQGIHYECLCSDEDLHKRHPEIANTLYEKELKIKWKTELRENHKIKKGEKIKPTGLADIVSAWAMQ